MMLQILRLPEAAAGVSGVKQGGKPKAKKPFARRSLQGRIGTSPKRLCGQSMLTEKVTDASVFAGRACGCVRAVAASDGSANVASARKRR